LPKDKDDRIPRLEQELRAKEEYLQTTLEEMETSNEELKSTNEEMQSVNEELQSTNEELETSKEELQSVNEELATVNAELQNKVADLSRINNDMNNLLAGTGVATLFVDLQLHITRFTPTTIQLINLIPGDLGRPVAHIVSNLNYDRLVADIESVLNTLVPQETEVQTKGGRWFQMRIRPYRTLENVIEGAVITFVDINTLKQVEEDQRHFAELSHENPNPVLRLSQEGRLLYANPSARAWLGAGGWHENQSLPAPLRALATDVQAPNRMVEREITSGPGRGFRFTAIRLEDRDYVQCYGCGGSQGRTPGKTVSEEKNSAQ
jgi:two-component system CheB/CheR fusion protein